LPKPALSLGAEVYQMVALCESVVVMTKSAAKILHEDYGIPSQKIEVIAHGTHLVPHLDKNLLKEKYGLTGHKVLSTFGLLGSGKAIETTLNALSEVIVNHPTAMFLIIGKTHPGVVLSEGENYRNMLTSKVEALGLQNHVQFINQYLPLADLLEYLSLTDIYLFTSKDPNQAVSGTFSYAMSCGCPIISTPIPHAKEVLRKDTGIIIDFQHSEQLAAAVNRLLGDEPLRMAFSSNTLHRIVPTAWENSAIAHALLIEKTANKNHRMSDSPTFDLAQLHQQKIVLNYRLPVFNLEHVKKMTSDFGMIQFSKINQPDIESGYTIDDNARAMIALCMHYEVTKEAEDLTSR
jgi:glycosyltransferase involved in cell wall biosynthesis